MNYDDFTVTLRARRLKFTNKQYFIYFIGNKTTQRISQFLNQTSNFLIHSFSKACLFNLVFNFLIDLFNALLKLIRD